MFSGQKGYERAYELAYKLAGEQLTKIDDIEQQCLKCGAYYRVRDSEKVITIEYLNQSYLITLPAINISLTDSAEIVSIKDKVLILHYFTLAKGTPLAGRLVTFRELPEGSVYFPTFSKRTSQPLSHHFGQNPHLLVEAGKKLGGYQVGYGDAAVTINAFNRVPITFVLWRGDAEFASQGSVLFDASVSDYLTTEDITVLGETITWRLIKNSREAS